MDYISVREAAELWGIDPSNIRKLLRKGKIEGAKIVARNWLIPKNAHRPIDGRTREAKDKEKASLFRFPLLVNQEEDAFSPELSEEERRLSKAELDFYACDFDKAKQAFDKLLYETGNIYVRIMVLFYLCSLSVEVYGGRDFKSYYKQLQMAFVGNYPYKKEMEIVTPWLYTVLAQFSSVSESLDLDTCYDYSPTVMPLLSYLSFYHIAGNLQAITGHAFSDPYELLCRQIEQSGAHYEACEAHFALFCASYLINNEEAMLYHLRKGMEIAREHNLPLIPASYLPYYPDAFKKIVTEYPDEFIKRIKKNAEIMSKSFSEFTDKYDITKIYRCLTSRDYRYLLFALNGCTNKQVAKIMSLSERTVTNRYTEIFNKLGINSKKELLELTDYRFKD